VDNIGGITEVNQTTSPTHALAIDSAGDVYVTGETISNDFPVANAYQATRNEPGGAYTAFVSALNPTGTALLYSTYLGGSMTGGGGADTDLGASIVWDSFDNAVYVVGTTNALDFPTTPGAFQKVFSGNFTAFVAKFNNAGQLTKSTYLGAPLTYGLGVATDSQGRAYVVGYTSYNCTPNGSTCPFPTTPRTVIPTPPASFNGYGFVSVFDTDLSTLLYSTLLGDPNAAPAGGGATTSEAFGVTVDPSGNFYVVGVTSSPSLPTTAGAFQRTLGVANSIPLAGFAAKFGPVTASGATLTYLTYLEATGVGFGDFPNDVVADSQGNAYIGGYTNSPTFPVTTGAYQTPCALNGAGLCHAAFVTKLNPTGTGLVWSALVEPADFFSSIQLDTKGNVYVAGDVPGSDPFVLVNPVQPGLNNGGCFVAELDPTGSTLLFSSLIQGGFTLRGLAVDALGSIYVASYTYDTTLPTTPGAFQTALKNPGTGNSYDGFIAKISLSTPSPTITEVANAEGEAPAIAPNTWVLIKGSNLANAGDSRIWLGSDFLNGQMPTQLDGVSVTMNDENAYVYYISPVQVNVLTPPDLAPGPVTVKVASGGTTSAAFTAQAQPLSPSFFIFAGGYVIGSHLNGTLLGPTSLYPGSSTPAQPGELVVLYANGFGPTSVPVVPGSSTQSGMLPTLPVIQIGGINAAVQFAGLVARGEYQFNVYVPSSAPNGDNPITAQYNGLSTQAGAVITVQQQ
jgi:uncharacterized protein (TIGR03437 family)